MRKISLAATAALALALGLSACSSTSPAATEDTMPSSSASQSMNDRSTPEAMTKVTGEFKGLNDKTVSGTVTVTNEQIALSGFSSDEGPDLHVYLTNGTDEAAVAAGMRIDKISYDTATQTFALNGVDTSKYTYVVIHCDKAKAVFGAAELS